MGSFLLCLHNLELKKIIIKKSPYFLIIFWLAVTVPLTLLGYGSDGDAWLVARTARNIYSAGEYFKSRTTGFPLFELAVTPLINIGHWYLSNLLPLLFGLMIFPALIRLGKKGKIFHTNIFLFSFMFLPVIIKNSTSTMDYIPALSLLIWAYTFLIEGKWKLTGFLIGVACGFRPTSGLFILPVLIYVFKENENKIQLIKLFLISVLVGTLAYSPALIKYGIPNPFGSIKLDQQIIFLITGYNFLKLFGIIQSVVLVVMAFLFGIKTIKSKNYNSFNLFHISNIAIWLILFFLLPDEPEYLLPLVPSIIFLLDRYLSKKNFIFISLLLFSYHFIQVEALGGHSGDRYIDIGIKNGYIIKDIQARIFDLSLRKAADNYKNPSKTLLMYGATVISADNNLWIKKNDIYCQQSGNFCVSGRIRDVKKLDNLFSEGYRIVVWKGEMWEYIRTGFTIPNYVEVIDNLSSFFGVKIKGQPINQ